MYCSPRWHDNTSKHKDLDTLKRNWIEIFQRTHQQNLKYKISFTGGEVTGNKHFLPFVKWLRTEYGAHLSQLLLTTNGSATLKYYTKLFEVIDNISFSTHSEHMNEQAFFDTVIALKNTISKDKFIHVNVMNEFWNQDRIAYYQKLLDDNHINYYLNQLNYSFQTRTIPIMKGKLNLAIP
jgi:molybdenum cofactor biosynthesis enzyme MoaA